MLKWLMGKLKGFLYLRTTDQAASRNCFAWFH